MHVEMGWICPIWPSARFATKLAPMCQKPCCLAVPLIKGWKIVDFLKMIFSIFWPIFLVFLCFFAVFLLLAIFWGWHAFCRYQQHQGEKIQLGFKENPYFEKLADLWQIWPYSQVQGPDSVIQSGASPGSSVGDTNDWILFLWFILIIFCLCFRSATSHPVQNTQNTVFWPKIPLFDP